MSQTRSHDRQGGQQRDDHRAGRSRAPTASPAPSPIRPASPPRSSPSPAPAARRSTATSPARRRGPAVPGMIVIHEAGGLNEHIRDVTNRFANLGYVALGVDLYTREGGPPPAGRRAGDDEAAVLDVRRRPCSATSRAPPTSCAPATDVTGKVGCIGFCMGGRYTLLFAVASDRLDAAVDCWGGFIDRPRPMSARRPTRPTPPLELAGKLQLPAARRRRRRRPEPLAGDRRAAARARRRERPGGQSRRLRGRRPRLLRRLPPDYRPEPRGQAVERDRAVPAAHLGTPERTPHGRRPAGGVPFI